MRSSLLVLLVVSVAAGSTWSTVIGDANGKGGCALSGTAVEAPFAKSPAHIGGRFQAHWSTSPEKALEECKRLCELWSSWCHAVSMHTYHACRFYLKEDAVCPTEEGSKKLVPPMCTGCHGNWMVGCGGDKAAVTRTIDNSKYATATHLAGCYKLTTSVKTLPPCPAGQHVSYIFTGIGSTCTTNKCTCMTGTPASGTDCPINGEVACTACRTGYDLQSDGSCTSSTLSWTGVIGDANGKGACALSGTTVEAPFVKSPAYINGITPTYLSGDDQAPEKALEECKMLCESFSWCHAVTIRTTYHVCRFYLKEDAVCPTEEGPPIDVLWLPRELDGRMPRRHGSCYTNH
jgi:hypothetical protein